MPNMIDQLARRPILANIGVLMSAVVAFAMISMASSAFIAETNEGMAAAINQSGSLRMQSYRIGVALADESLHDRARAESAAALTEEFETRLRSPRLVGAIPGHTADDVAMQYARITELWEQQMEPPLTDHIHLLGSDAAPGSEVLPRAAYLAGVDRFVAEIDRLVYLLEEVAERRIDLLRVIQAIALALTVIIVVVTMALVLRRVVRPLGELLACADRVRQGDFSGRTDFTGNDELGRLGAAFNLMAESLSEIYGELEQRVADKTRDLARTNHSLELLYRASKTLNEEPVSERLLETLAGHIGTALKLQQRMRESRRLVLHEERGIIARELHDSLAQSLSYLKIQVTRLSVALDAPEDAHETRVILNELREGISSAYRQLRELLTTFRLRMDDRGLGRALEDTVQEFRGRSATRIRLDNRLPGSTLSPNEEIHVLQIVREALSNVIRHAGADNARVSLAAHDSLVEVEIRDDGCGCESPHDRTRHYGLSIMRERTLSLDGDLTLESPPGSGTCVRLRFRPRSARNDVPEPVILGAT